MLQREMQYSKSQITNSEMYVGLFLTELFSPDQHLFSQSAILGKLI